MYEYKTLTITDELDRPVRGRRPEFVEAKSQEAAQWLTENGKQGFRLVQVVTLGGDMRFGSQGVMLIMEREKGQAGG